MKNYCPNRFDIIKTHAFLDNLDTISPGCSFPDEEPETIKEFRSLDEALEELEKYKSYIGKVDMIGASWEIEEYGVVAYEADDDGFLNGSDFYPGKFDEDSINRVSDALGNEESVIRLLKMFEGFI